MPYAQKGIQHNFRSDSAKGPALVWSLALHIASSEHRAGSNSKYHGYDHTSHQMQSPGPPVTPQNIRTSLGRAWNQLPALRYRFCAPVGSLRVHGVGCLCVPQHLSGWSFIPTLIESLLLPCILLNSLHSHHGCFQTFNGPDGWLDG